MRGKRLSAKFGAIVMALCMLPANLLFLAGCGEKGESGHPSANVYSSAAQPQSTSVTFPEKAAGYDFYAGTEAADGWQAYNNVSEQAGTGVSFAGGFKNVAQSYSVANPLKGKATEGFTVVLHAEVTGTINHYESMFGFSDNSDPTKITKFFNVSGSGKGVHLNRVGEGGTYDYYDITKQDGDVLTIGDADTYVFTLDAAAVRIYLNGELKETYARKERTETVTEANKGNYVGSYSYDTLDFVNAADWFNLGASCAYWGQPEMLVKDVAFYGSAFTAEQAAAVDDQYADLSELRAMIMKADTLDYNDYDSSMSGWNGAYANLETANAAAKKISCFTTDQQTADDAADALSAAMEALKAFLRESDLTEGLAAAYPLSADGNNLVSGKTGKVQFMNGDALSDITPALTARKQRITGTRLFDESKLHPRDRWDTSKTSTTGLKIPADAFDAGMLQTGMTITVKVYAESLYNGWARIFQLGSRASGDGYSDGTGIFVAYEKGTFRINYKDNATIYFDTYGDPVCTVIAGEWITFSISFNPYVNLISYCVLSNTNSRFYDTVAGVTVKFDDEAVFNEIFRSIVEGTDNWIGRSYWSGDGNQVAYASSLTVYDRALSVDELMLLHETADLSALVTA